MHLSSDNGVSSNFVISPLLGANRHLSMPNSMPVSSLKIPTVWTSDSKSFSFLTYSFKSSVKRRWFIFSLLLENWYALSYLHRITVNGIRQSTNNKDESESPWNILRFISTPASGFISSITFLSVFLRMLYFLSSISLFFFLIFLFSSKLFTKSESRPSSFKLPCNRLIHQGSIFVFGILLAPTNSETYAAAAYIVLFNLVRFRISIFLSTEMTLFTPHFTFAFRIPRNDFNCSFRYYIQIYWVVQIFHFHLLVKLDHVSLQLLYRCHKKLRLPRV